MHFLSVKNTNRPGLIGDRIEVADTSMRRLIGLLGRRGLRLGEGLWIRPSSGVHTLGMSFPIDVIGLDRNFIVLKLWHALRPFRVTSLHWCMGSVLELPAGTIRATNVQIGDRLNFLTVEDRGDRA